MNVSEDVGGGRPGAEELLLRVAWFYYKDELTQDEIAKRLAVSRASVGRMLDRARRVGLVSINLNADHLDAFEVSGRLRRAFNLTEALVVPDHEKEPADRHILNARLGLGGAQFMSTPCGQQHSRGRLGRPRVSSPRPISAPSGGAPNDHTGGVGATADDPPLRGGCGGAG